MGMERIQSNGRDEVCIITLAYLSRRDLIDLEIERVYLILKKR